ncbi:ammonium transporter 3 member 1-like [Panicum miliaceum]|uniref:Ammonium transporter 3 member 1-like n=1 Tax=Panicum miliaceum TaxID=4540 RepID=A0A3L6QZN0_PANMI|nr:ammonium transporter 3 member 1-like [Panicum miliaceum]
MGIVSGSRGRCPSTPTMNRCCRGFLQEEVDDTLGILHTHAVSGLLGGVLTGVFAHPVPSRYQFEGPHLRRPCRRRADPEAGRGRVLCGWMECSGHIGHLGSRQGLGAFEDD